MDCSEKLIRSLHTSMIWDTRSPRPSGAYRLGEKDTQAEDITNIQQRSHGGEQDRGEHSASPGGGTNNPRRRFPAGACWQPQVTDRVRGHVNKEVWNMESPLKIAPRVFSSEPWRAC